MNQTSKNAKRILERIRHGLPLALVVDAGGAMVRCSTGPHARSEAMAIPGEAEYVYRTAPRWMGDPTFRRITVLDPTGRYRRIGSIERRLSDVPRRGGGWRYFPRPDRSHPTARWGEAVFALVWCEVQRLRLSRILDSDVECPVTAVWYEEPDSVVEPGPARVLVGDAI